MAQVLEDVFIEYLRELDGTEREQEQFLKSMAEAASNPEIQDAFKKHAETTRRQSERAKKMLATIGEGGEAQAPEPVKALMADAQKKMALDADDEVIDLQLIASARKMEHLEMASYSIALAIAKSMGQDEIAGLLDETLREEQASDRNFEQLARPVLKEAEEKQETEVEAEVDESDEDIGIPEIQDEEDTEDDRPAKGKTRRAG